MMKQCNKCIFYNKEFDEKRQSLNDIIWVGKEESDEHYCGIFQPVSKEYVNDDAKCPAFIKNKNL